MRHRLPSLSSSPSYHVTFILGNINIQIDELPEGVPWCTGVSQVWQAGDLLRPQDGWARHGEAGSDTPAYPVCCAERCLSSRCAMMWEGLGGLQTPSVFLPLLKRNPLFQCFHLSKYKLSSLETVPW